MAEYPTNNLIFEQIKSGDLKSYERLFRQLYSPLTNYAYKVVKDKMIAEEIAQEVFMYLWDKRGQINISSSLTSYLYSATKNRCINYLKLELPKRQAEIEISEIDIADQIREITPGQQEKIKKVVDMAIDTLPEKCKEAFILSRYSGLTYDEIAEEMDLSKKTVENQIGIALKKLRVLLKPLMDEMKK